MKAPRARSRVRRGGSGGGEEELMGEGGGAREQELQSRNRVQCVQMRSRRAGSHQDGNPATHPPCTHPYIRLQRRQAAEEGTSEPLFERELAVG
ncbi:hypothetical protein NDU88_007778 [Pleurodeles waltl]|uniref:Uncharacterized protein n=1 Tax=Pleurodeles waltl TaxID=8319 RepID=A0AAV7VTM0_PLEWA|nr:hypothetical protein NDU88_007778 [Pleurodeles waltl]